MTREKLLKAFGRVLREQRDKKSLSQEHLALMAEVDRTFVSQIERGLNQPSITTLWKLCGTLEIDPSRFIAEVERTIEGQTRAKKV